MTIKEMINYIYGDIDGQTRCFQTYYKVKEKKGKEKMKESKFKVGEKVIIKDGSKIKDYQGGWIKDMADYIGRKCTISFVSHRHDGSFAYRMKEFDYTWDERGLEPADGTIIISKKENKITAKCDGFTGIARCNPEDDFDFKTGVNLAIERLFENMNIIKEGDWVEVIDPGYTYSTLPNWVSENIKDKTQIARYRYGSSPEKFMEGKVLKIAKHTIFNDLLAYIDGYNGCYAIGIKGLKKVEK